MGNTSSFLQGPLWMDLSPSSEGVRKSSWALELFSGAVLIEKRNETFEYRNTKKADRGYRSWEHMCSRRRQRVKEKTQHEILSFEPLFQEY